MREIKFRAWDKQTQKMIYSNEVYPKSEYKFEFDLLSKFDFKLVKMVDRYNVTDEDGENTYVEVFEAVDADIMQYTELKDKNGNEIYEGDIYECCEGRHKVVVWKDNGFRLKFAYTRTYQGERYTETNYLELRNTSSNRWGGKVIGNIYENEDLLK